ncbi:hypothetical protein Poly30_15120 [Planctomycetes bacterium Poly30]|uniref:DUF58 domain-containing protein n=1 Tax=Saltatorellus ferox TaxID=2528018 RepID=A0A518EPJ3_9BACT|nr:hypothetical protein Poly30_15120 [Planctomycetes bacterium Poly30]
MSEFVSPSEAALREGARWTLSLHHAPRGGVTGDLLGRGSGSSMEFHDRRPYSPGDDVRHIDWRALARSDEVLVRVHREEVAPRLDLFVDTSSSMATTESKAQRAVDLVAVLARAARAGGYAVRLVGLGDRVERISVEELLGEGLRFASKRPLHDLVAEAGGDARPSSVRVVVSDFLVPADPGRLVQPFARDAGRVVLLQVLSKDDAEPEAHGALRLVDSEHGGIREVVVDRSTLRRYAERLARLQSGLAEAVRRHGGLFLPARSDLELSGALESLARGGLLDC